MAETQTQSSKQENAKQETKPEAKQNGTGLTRIPVTKVWLREQLDLPGGNAIMGRVDCLPQTAPGRQFFVGHFVPAHQVIEVNWYKNEKVEPICVRIPLSIVKSFE